MRMASFTADGSAGFHGPSGVKKARDVRAREHPGAASWPMGSLGQPGRSPLKQGIRWRYRNQRRPWSGENPDSAAGPPQQGRARQHISTPANQAEADGRRDRTGMRRWTTNRPGCRRTLKPPPAGRAQCPVLTRLGPSPVHGRRAAPGRPAKRRREKQHPQQADEHQLRQPPAGQA
jgi:hypothetical protein